MYVFSIIASYILTTYMQPIEKLTPARMRLLVLAVNCCQSLMGRSVIIYTTFTDYTMYTVTTDRYAKAKVGIK